MVWEGRSRKASPYPDSYRNAAQSVPGTMRMEATRRLSLHWASLAEENADFSIVIVFRYVDDLIVGFKTPRNRATPRN